MAVIEAVAAVTGRRVTELPPLQNAADADALDALLVDAPEDVCVSFRYAGVEVTVDADGGLTVR